MLKVNLCCGMDYREGYTNIDFSEFGSDGKPIKVDMLWDILEDGLPCELADEVVFHESLEHFNRHNGLRVLQTIYAMLKFGGKLSLTVPNATQQLKILLTKMNANLSMDDFFNAHEKFSYWKFHDDLMGGTRPSDGMDGDSHKTLWTPSGLRAALEHFGFKIQKIDIDSSIRVEAIK